MARIAAILRAVLTAFRRDQKSIFSVVTNYFFPAVAYFLGQAGVFLFLLAGLILLFPLSGDPLRKIPPERLSSWPLTHRERRLLRLASPWLNPMTWILAAVALWGLGRAVSLGLWGVIAAIFVTGFVAPTLPFSPRRGLWRIVPNFPGPLNQLIRKNLREMLTTLDFYCALLLSLAAAGFRVLGPKAPPEMPLAMTILVVLAFASFATCLFGLDGDGGLTRYRLLPVRGWQLLAAKDAAFLLMVAILTFPLAPLPGLAAAFITLAIGHGPSVRERRKQTRWRFSSGSNIGTGIVVLLGITSAAAGTFYNGPFVLLLACATHAGSTYWWGRQIDRGGDSVMV